LGLGGPCACGFAWGFWIYGVNPARNRGRDRIGYEVVKKDMTIRINEQIIRFE
jgi:hypothetical protein